MPEVVPVAEVKISNNWRLSVYDNVATGRTVKAETEIFFPSQRSVIDIDLLCVPPDGLARLTVESFATPGEDRMMAAVPLLMKVDGAQLLPVGNIQWSGGVDERLDEYFGVGEYNNEIESTSELIFSRLPVTLEVKTERGAVRFQMPAENEQIQAVLSECRDLREHRSKRKQADEEKFSAELSESMRSYAQRPREKRIYSRTKEYKYASYMHDWIAKVERIGTLNFPDEARRQHLSGSLLLDVALNADGSINNIAVLHPSGYRVLDDAALRIVKMAAPYAPFPDYIRRDYDVLHIIRTWDFLSNEQLSPK